MTLDELEKLAKAATPGPWEAIGPPQSPAILCAGHDLKTWPMRRKSWVTITRALAIKNSTQRTICLSPPPFARQRRMG